jgi:hypothetical protein
MMIKEWKTRSVEAAVCGFAARWVALTSGGESLEISEDGGSVLGSESKNKGRV